MERPKRQGCLPVSDCILLLLQGCTAWGPAAVRAFNLALDGTLQAVVEAAAAPAARLGWMPAS
eukprot:scaffold234025_cov22-Prasinocladus_malaysianus.AAC.1